MTVIVYLPGFRRVTFVPAFLTVIVKPGPVTPVSLIGVVAVVPAGAESGSARAAKRTIEISIRFNDGSFRSKDT